MATQSAYASTIPYSDSVWTNDNNVLGAPDGATIEATYSAGTNDFHVGGFGFTIPAGSTVTGISCSVRAKISTAGNSALRRGSADIKNNLTVLGTAPTTNNTDATLTTSLADYTIGGSSDLWGWTPDVSVINSSTFSIFLPFYNGDGTNRTFYVDSVQMTITYTPPITTNNLFFGSNF